MQKKKKQQHNKAPMNYFDEPKIPKCNRISFYIKVNRKLNCPREMNIMPRVTESTKIQSNFLKYFLIELIASLIITGDVVVQNSFIA